MIPRHRLNSIIQAMAENDIDGAQRRTDSLIHDFPRHGGTIRMAIAEMWVDHINECPNPDAHIGVQSKRLTQSLTIDDPIDTPTEEPA